MYKFAIYRRAVGKSWFCNSESCGSWESLNYCLTYIACCSYRAWAWAVRRHFDCASCYLNCSWRAGCEPDNLPYEGWSDIDEPPCFCMWFCYIAEDKGVKRDVIMMMVLWLWAWASILKAVDGQYRPDIMGLFLIKVALLFSFFTIHEIPNYTWWQMVTWSCMVL